VTDAPDRSGPGTTPETTVYEVRIGRDLSSLKLLVGALVMAGVGFLFPDLWVKVVWIGVLVLFAAVFAIRMLRRPLALRVDAEGVTLGSVQAFGSAKITARESWDDLAAVVLFGRSSGALPKVRCIGLMRLDDQSGAAPDARPDARPDATFAHVPADVVQRSLMITGWRLDRRRLADAIAAHAPDVDLLDLGG
jgi:hypothetical protein